MSTASEVPAIPVAPSSNIERILEGYTYSIMQYTDEELFQEIDYQLNHANQLVNELGNIHNPLPLFLRHKEDLVLCLSYINLIKVEQERRYVA